MGRWRDILGLPETTADERARAIAHPGPSWQEYFYFQFLKMWIALGFLILDAWIAVLFLEPTDLPAMAAALAGALYLEFLAYRYLWFRPALDESPHFQFRRTWSRPVRFGRWTPEMFRLREGLEPYLDGTRGPDPREFL